MRHTLVLSALLGTGLLAATSISQAASDSLVFCSEGSPAGFDTAQYTTATDNDAAEPLYNRLAEFEKGATNVVPGLATRWDISEDGLKYTFHLREGVKFHTTKYSPRAVISTPMTCCSRSTACSIRSSHSVRLIQPNSRISTG